MRLGIVRILRVSGHTFCYQAMLLTVFKAQIGRRSASPDLGLEIRFFITNPSDFKLVFKTQKNHKNCSQGPQKTTQVDPEIHKKQIQ